MMRPSPTILLPSILVLSLGFTSTTVEGQRYQDDIFNNIVVTNNIVYGNAVNDRGSNQNLLFDFYEPEGDNLEKRPLLIWIHGGSFVNGSKSDFNIVSFSEYLVPKGYTTAHISYRLSSTQVLGSDASVDTLALYVAVHNAVHDARSAVRYFKLNSSQYRIDPEQIYVAGLSAGAITAIELAYIDRVEELYPNATPLDVEGNSGNNGPDSSVHGVVSLCGTSIEPGIIEGPLDPPLFIAHDERDPIVPYSATRATFDRAAAVGTRVIANIYDTGFHCSWSIPLIGLVNLIDVQNQLRAFLFGTIATANEEISLGSDIEVFPNPFLDFIRIKSGKSRDIEFRLVNNLGQVVLRGSIPPGTSQFKLDSSLPPGLYFIVSEGSLNEVISVAKSS